MMLSKLRKNKKMTQKQLASQVGCSRTLISSYENFLTPSLQNMQKLADALEVDLQTIVQCFVEDKIKSEVENEDN